MKRITLIIIGLVLTFGLSFGQSNPFDRLNFIMGEWSGTGSGFGNEKSKIESSFQFVMEEKYIEVKNESRFEPTFDVSFSNDGYSCFGVNSLTRKQ